jgi:hypothetical protein
VKDSDIAGDTDRVANEGARWVHTWWRGQHYLTDVLLDTEQRIRD